VFSSL